METDPDPFGFNSLYYIQSIADSKKLNNSKKPCVIISASGMMEAGRVKHHLANSISNQKIHPRSWLLFPKYIGAKILRGEKKVSIFGTEYEVKADIERIDAYSGHGDYKEMIEFLNCQDKSQLQKVFIVHGEYKAQHKPIKYRLKKKDIKILKYLNWSKSMNCSEYRNSRQSAVNWLLVTGYWLLATWIN